MRIWHIANVRPAETLCLKVECWDGTSKISAENNSHNLIILEDKVITHRLWFSGFPESFAATTSDLWHVGEHNRFCSANEKNWCILLIVVEGFFSRKIDKTKAAADRNIESENSLWHIEMEEQYPDDSYQTKKVLLFPKGTKSFVIVWRIGQFSDIFYAWMAPLKILRLDMRKSATATR